MLELDEFKQILEGDPSPGNKKVTQLLDRPSIDSFRRLLAEHGSDEEDIRFVFEVLGLEAVPPCLQDTDTSAYSQTTDTSKLCPGSTSESSHAITHQNAVPAPSLKPGQSDSKNLPRGCPAGQIETHVAAYRNACDKMVIVRVFGDDGFFLERVVFPFELLSFRCPLNSEVQILSHPIDGPDLLEAFASSTLSLHEDPLPASSPLDTSINAKTTHSLSQRSPQIGDSFLKEW